MAFRDGWDSSALLGGYNITIWVKSADVSREMDVNERTAWGNGGSRAYRAGLVTGTVSFEIFDDEGDGVGVDGIAEILRSFVRSTGTPLTIGHETPVVGGPTTLCAVIPTSIGPSADFESIREGSLEVQPSGGIEDGVWLKTLAAETASTTSSSVDNTAATTGGYVVHQHVTAKSGTTPTLVTTIEHSTDNVTFATLVELASVNAVGSTRVVGTGTVNRYRRRKSTIAGTNPSFTHAVTLATW